MQTPEGQDGRQTRQREQIRAGLDEPHTAHYLFGQIECDPWRKWVKETHGWRGHDTLKALNMEDFPHNGLEGFPQTAPV